MSTTITLANLSKSFGGSSLAVDDVSLRVEGGELFFLLGPSGCGKTTLLRMIAGFTEPTSGSVAFETRTTREDGSAETRVRDVTHLPPNKRNTGMVFQSYALWPHMTVEANVGFGLTVQHVGSAERKRRVAEALELVRMARYAARKPNQLSGGQQQRVALARAIVVRPDVLLLDEPLSNLDAKLRAELRSEIRRICKEARVGSSDQGMTAVYVTHDQKEALSMADRIAIMRDGRVVQVGTPRELYRDPSSMFVAEFLGETNFVPGEARVDGDRVRVMTPAGEFIGRLPGGAGAHRAPSDGSSEVVCSIRPEALRIAKNGGTGINTFTGMVTRTTYLGETAQLDVALQRVSASDGTAEVHIKILVMNPSNDLDRAPVAVEVDPVDVVVLPVS